MKNTCIQQRYFAVKTKNGHSGLGRGYYMPITYAVMAISAKDAAKQARQIPRVKHDHRDAILEVHEISKDESLEIKKANNDDSFLQAKCKQEQLATIPYDILMSRLMPEPQFLKKIENKQEGCKSMIYAGKMHLKKPNRYFRNFNDECRLSRKNKG